MFLQQFKWKRKNNNNDKMAEKSHNRLERRNLIKRKDDSLSRQISNVHESIVERSEDVCNSEDIFTFTGLKFKRSKNLRLQKWLKKFIPNKIPSVLEHYMYLRTKRDVLFSTLLFLTLSWSHTMEIKRKITA